MSLLSVALSLMLLSPPAAASDSLAGDTLRVIPLETAKTTDVAETAIPLDTLLTKHGKKKKRIGFIKRIINSFTDYDTTYVTPNYYQFTVMGQNSNYFQRYRLSASNGNKAQAISMRPAPSVKMGPYFGWSLLFFGVTFDVTRPKELGKSTELNLSLYSTVLGGDLYYVKNEGNFRLRRTTGFDNIASDAYKGTDFTGMETQTIALSAYYVFNHRHFSYPSAYNQSTVQRKSCGSWMLGAGFSQQTVEFDLTRLPAPLKASAIEELRFSKLKYDYYYLSLGYAYNWVFAKNWILGVSVMPTLGYRKAHGSKMEASAPLKDIHNLSFDCISRAGIVRNNTKWFIGASFISNLYTYRKKALGFTNSANFLNVYAGFYFRKKKAYR